MRGRPGGGLCRRQGPYVLARELTLAEVLAGQVAATGVSRRASAGRAPSLGAQRRLFVCDRPHGGGTPRRGLVGLLAKAAIEAAQAALAGRGEWALTEKAIVRRAALGARVEAILAAPGDRAFDAPAARDARRAPRVHRAGAGRGGGRALRPVIGRRFALERAAAAHATIETRATVGKTLLEVGPAS